MALILKNNFIDHTDGMKEYKTGEDVSHLSNDLIAHLKKGDNLETEKEPKEQKKK